MQIKEEDKLVKNNNLFYDYIKLSEDTESRINFKQDISSLYKEQKKNKINIKKYIKHILTVPVIIIFVIFITTNQVFKNQGKDI